jgi:hypothetical protein
MKSRCKCFIVINCSFIQLSLVDSSKNVISSLELRVDTFLSELESVRKVNNLIWSVKVFCEIAFFLLLILSEVFITSERFFCHVFDNHRPTCFIQFNFEDVQVENAAGIFEVVFDAVIKLLIYES